MFTIYDSCKLDGEFLAIFLCPVLLASRMQHV